MPENLAQLEKIARMAVFDIPQAQIARAMGLTEGRISQLVNTDDYRTALSAISTEFFEQNQLLNDGWDSIEAQSLNILITNLKWRNDPDFALKVASVANRANRRGSISNRTIDGQTGARAIFHLTANFVNRLQQIKVVKNGQDEVPKNGNDVPETITLVQKESNFMTPEKVEKLFMEPNKDKTESLLDFFPQFDNMAPAE